MRKGSEGGIGDVHKLLHAFFDPYGPPTPPSHIVPY